MGIVGSSAGVTLRFMDATGTSEVQLPVTGTFSDFFASPRPESPGNTDVLFGSPDWLTDALVTDHLRKLVELPTTGEGTAFTSSSSKRVTVQYSVGNIQAKLTDCLTIVRGTQTSSTDPVVATEIVVLPPETDMKPGHALFAEWAAGASASQAIKAARTQQAAQQVQAALQALATKAAQQAQPTNQPATPPVKTNGSGQQPPTP